MLNTGYGLARTLMAAALAGVAQGGAMPPFSPPRMLHMPPLGSSKGFAAHDQRKAKKRKAVKRARRLRHA